MYSKTRAFCALFCIVFTLHCKTYLGQADKGGADGGSSGGGGSGGGTSGYTIGGTVSGLSGTLVLQNNGGDNLTLSTNGAFTFTTTLANGSAYNITILTQPTGQECELANESGTIVSANVTNVVVVCNSLYDVGGSVSGLSSSTLVLQLNGGSDKTITTNGAYTFTTKVADTKLYEVTVKDNPSELVCMVHNNAGVIAGANVTNMNVQCATDTNWT